MSIAKAAAPILLFCLFVASASAQTPVMNYNGAPISCMSSLGTPALFYFDPQAAALATNSGGGYATINHTGAHIALNLQQLNSMPVLSAFMVIYHECAHVNLPFGVGLGTPAQELNADCHAIRTMRDQGLITNWNDFSQAMTQLSMMHSPMTVARIQNMQQCIVWP